MFKIKKSQNFIKSVNTVGAVRYGAYQRVAVIREKFQN